MADKADVFKTLKSLFTTVKSIPDADVEDVFDIWTQENGQHAVPSKEEVKTGPSESADGEGAFKMIERYSNPAPQTKMVEGYDHFSKYLEGMGKAMKALHDQNKAIAAVLLKAEEAPAVVTNDFLVKAETRLKLAKAALRKADMADEDEKEEKEEAVEKAERALEAAKKLIVKAEKENEDDMDDNVAESCEKAMSEFKKLSKALVKAKAELPAPVVKAEDDKKEDDKEEIEKAAAAKAIADAAAATTAKADPDRLTILENSIEGLMKTLAGTSKSAPLPDLMKSFPTESVGEKIEAAMDEGTMNDGEIMKAKDILSRFEAAKNGAYDGVKLHQEIDAAPEKVRALFKAAA